jgi:hypothetical protein
MPRRGDFSKDKSERWLLTQQAGSILRLAGITGFTSWQVAESSLIAPRRLPDGLVNVTFPDRPRPAPFIIEIESYANADADRQMYEDLLIAPGTGCNRGGDMRGPPAEGQCPSNWPFYRRQ